MNILLFPNEILLEIFAYLNHDNKTTFFTYNREPEPWAVELPDRETLFDLRLVCKAFEQIVTPMAFSVLRLVHNLEHTQTLVDKVANRQSEPLLAHVRHFTISPKGMVKRVFKFEDGTVTCTDLSIVGDEEGDPYMQGGIAQRTWAKLMFAELCKLFASWPECATELTIRDFDTYLDVPGIDHLDDWFFVSLSLALQTACIRPWINGITVNIYISFLRYLSYLWRQSAEDTVTSVFEDRDPSTGPLFGYDTSSQTYFPGRLHKVRIFSKDRVHNTHFLYCIANYICGDKRIEHILLRLDRNPRWATTGFEIANCAKLKSLTLEGVTCLDHSLLLLVRKMESLVHLKLSSCDIWDNAPVGARMELVDEQIDALLWAHIFEALRSLPNLLSFQGGDLSYQSIRHEYGQTPVVDFWLLTERAEDFKEFASLRKKLLAREGVEKLLEARWLLQQDAKWAAEGEFIYGVRGVPLSQLEANPKYQTSLQRHVVEHPVSSSEANEGSYDRSSDEESV